MSPFFSIIIPTYNRAHFIPVAIDSIINQSFIDWELIVVDDGSLDNTKEIVKKYSDARIRYIYQQNSERSVARNNGIKNAKGEYICFLDSDDYYLANHLEVFYNEIIKQNKAVAFFYSELCFEKSNGEPEYYKCDTVYKGNIDFVFYRIIHSQQVCIHREILKKHFFNPLFHVGEDIELWIRIWSEYPVIFINNPTVVIVDHQQRTVNVKNIDTYAAMIALINFVFSKHHPGHKIACRFKKIIRSSAYFNISRCYIYNNKKWNAIRYLICSIYTKVIHAQTRYKLFLLFKLLFGHVRKEDI